MKLSKKHLLCRVAGALSAISLITMAGSSLAEDCEVFPGQFNTKEDGYLVHYEGDCKNGVAHGEGVAKAYLTLTRDFNSDDLSANDPRYALVGRFQEGVFVGSEKVPARFEYDGRNIIAEIRGLKGTEVWVEPQSKRYEPVDVCSTRVINVAVDDVDSYAKDDEKYRELLDGAIDLFTSMCVIQQQVPFLLVNREAVKRFNGNSADIMASYYPDGERKYTNRLYDRYESKRKAEAYREKKLAERQLLQKDLRKFFADTKITDFVTADALIKNPFLYQDKNVGVMVLLSEMISAHEAYVIGGDGYSYRKMHLKGIEPDYFSDKPVFLSVKVLGKSESDAGSAVQLEYIGHKECGKKGCEDFIEALNN